MILRSKTGMVEEVTAMVTAMVMAMVNMGMVIMRAPNSPGIKKY
jgi:hypothetical protein